MSGMRDEIAYLRRYADAASTLAEMAMVAGHSLSGLRYVAYYDDDESEWVISRQWYGDDGRLIENEMCRYQHIADAVEAAYRMVQEERP